MGNDEKWYFTKEQLENSPSRKCGIDSRKELSYRQQAANFIRDMGHNLKVSQLCMNTAIVYMHRFYVFHSFTHFPWHSIAAAALFLAAKVEEQPRKVEYVVKIAYVCKNHKELNFELNPEKYQMLSQDLVFNENILLQTLGFDVAIDHPHTHIVRCCHLVRAGKDLAHTSYFMASNSLHLTTMCLQYKPTVVACFCIHLACKWSQWEIPLSNEKKEWFSYVDPSVTAELLQQLTEEFLVVFDQSQSRLKQLALKSQSPFEYDPKKGEPSDSKDLHMHRSSHHGEGKSGVEDPHKHRSRPHEHSTNVPLPRDREREYREKKEREKLALQQQHGSKPPGHSNPPNKQSVPHHYHRSEAKQHSRPPVPSGSASHSRQEPRDILREASRDVFKDHRDSKRESVKDQTVTREHQLVRGSSDKDMPKQDYLLKQNTSDLNSYQDVRLNCSADKQRTDSSRSLHADPNKVPLKHEQVRRHDELYVKNETEIKKHLSASARDKNSVYMNKSNVHSTSQKVKLPFNQEASKSVHKQSSINSSSAVKHEAYNGGSSNSGSYSASVLDDAKVKPENKMDGFAMPTKKPSLFSPEKSPPKKLNLPVKNELIIKQEEISNLPHTSNILDSSKRSRTVSGSEPELRPVMKKIDQVEGFETLMRDSSIGIKNLHQVPDIITPITDIKVEKVAQSSYSKEMKPPDLIPPFSSASLPQTLVNGIETNPTLISNLLKEAPSVPHLPAVAATNTQSQETKDKEKAHHHKEHKKKNKEKHKHKDKDRSKEEKEKKKKHKDKDREKHKNKDKQQKKQEEEPPVTQPIKITIQKDKIQPVENHSPGPSLKIKIPKDRVKTENIVEPTASFKIKISKEFINSCSENKKREREKSSPTDAPPSKTSRTSNSRYGGEPKQNGRHSHSKVSNSYSNVPPQSNIRSPPYNNNKNVNLIPPMYPTQAAPPPHYFYYGMQVPPPSVSLAPNLNIPPPPYMYQPYYGHGYMYQHPHEMYTHPIPAENNVPPPLPCDAPPDVPPPPPPE